MKGLGSLDKVFTGLGLRKGGTWDVNVKRKLALYNEFGRIQNSNSGSDKF